MQLIGWRGGPCLRQGRLAIDFWARELVARSLMASYNRKFDRHAVAQAHVNTFNRGWSYYSRHVMLSRMLVITVLVTPYSRAKRLMVPRGPGS